MCCVLLIRLITIKETCNHLFRGVKGEEGRVLGISEGVTHASNKDGFYIVHYNQANSIANGLTWRQKWQSFVSLVAPSFLLNGFAS